jgi:hypothetical protein
VVVIDLMLVVVTRTCPVEVAGTLDANSGLTAESR